MENRDFIAIAKYAAILATAVSLSTVSARAESMPADIDTPSLQNQAPYPIADTASTQSQLIHSVSIQPESMRPSVDTAPAKPVLAPPVPPAYNINYTGAALSAFVPGSGQIYQSRYVMGGLFFAAEAATAGFAVYWSSSADARFSDAKRLAGVSDSLGKLGLAAGGDSALLYRAGLYSVTADETAFEARASKHTAYNALAWAAGLHLYNILDALEAGGLTARGLEKNPTTAGLLAAVPFLSLGQLYNERPSKAGMLAAAQAGLALTAYNQHRLMSIASEKYNQMRDSTSAQYAYRADHQNYWKSRYDSAFSSRNTYLWLSLAAYLYSIFDAVVDAHLSDFNAKIDLGTDLSVAPNSGGVAVNVTVGLKR